MSDAVRIGANTDVMLPTPVAAASGMPSSAQTEDRAARRKKVTTEPELGDGLDGIVHDSAQVSLVGTLISQATSGSDVRFQKVASLRQAIKAGIYRVSAADLAEKMIEDMFLPRASRRIETVFESEIDAAAEISSEVEV
jgi:flagellar biosynthesis anti-sigma factor FlgM